MATPHDPEDGLFPTDPLAIARLEARNGILQFEEVVRLIREALSGDPFKLQPFHLLELNRLAISGLSPSAGTYRSRFVNITGSLHAPPSPVKVAFLVEELCDYVNDNSSSPAIHLAAYVLWRVGWIHPFDDGNGRTARAAAYLVLCVGLGLLLPGKRTITEQLAENKQAYFDALEAADHAWQSEKRIDVGKLEWLLRHLLANQLGEAVHDGEED